MKKLTVLLLLLLLLVGTSLPAAAGAAPIVLDEGDMLTSEEELQLTHGCSCIACDYPIYLVTVENAFVSLSDTNVLSICGIDENDDAIVLVVRTFDKHYYDMYTYGEAYKAFSDDEIDRILDDTNVYGYLKRGDIVNGFDAFHAACSAILEEHWHERQERLARAPMTALLTALVVGVLAGGLSVLGVFLHYRKKRHGESYPLDRYAKLNLTEHSDVFVGSYVTRVRVQSNSSGGGRSGGSRGGGHRGGR